MTHHINYFDPRVTHGHSTNGKRSSEYMAWDSMRQRCYNPNYSCYHRYGGRGIRVTWRWLISFDEFLRDMGCKPSSLHTLDRIDNDGDYEPDNCRWITRKEQAENRGNNILVTYEGETKTLKQWATHFDMSYNSLYYHWRKTRSE